MFHDIHTRAVGSRFAGQPKLRPQGKPAESPLSKPLSPLQEVLDIQQRIAEETQQQEAVAKARQYQQTLAGTLPILNKVYFEANGKRFDGLFFLKLIAERGRAHYPNMKRHSVFTKMLGVGWIGELKTRLQVKKMPHHPKEHPLVYRMQLYDIMPQEKRDTAYEVTQDLLKAGLLEQGYGMLDGYRTDYYVLTPVAQMILDPTGSTGFFSDPSPPPASSGKVSSYPLTAELAQANQWLIADQERRRQADIRNMLKTPCFEFNGKSYTGLFLLQLMDELARTRHSLNKVRDKEKRLSPAARSDLKHAPDRSFYAADFNDLFPADLAPKVQKAASGFLALNLLSNRWNGVWRLTDEAHQLLKTTSGDPQPKGDE